MARGLTGARPAGIARCWADCTAWSAPAELAAAADQIYPLLLHGARAGIDPERAAVLVRVANAINAN